MPIFGQLCMRMEIKGANYEPHSPEEQVKGISLLLPVPERGGFVFLVAHTKKETADSELLMQTLSEQIHRLADSFGKEANPQHRFEQFLGAINETLAHQVREGRWNVPIKEFHALVGIVSESEMYLSGTGELVALFLHKKPSQRYQVFNLFRNLQTEQSLLTWEKPFAVVLDGDLHPGDVFCVSNKDLQRTIPVDELNHILSSLPPIGSVEKIRQYFSHKDAVLLSVIKMMDAHAHQQVHADRTATPQSNLSVEALNETEGLTDRLLEDQRPNPTILLKRLKETILAKTDQRSRLIKDLYAGQGLKSVVRRVTRTVSKGTLIAAGKLARRTQHTISSLKEKEGRERVKEHLQIKQQSLNSGANSFIEMIKGVPRSTKYLAGGITVAVVVLILGISTISRSQAQAADEKAYQEQLTAIEDLMEQAAGAVIYKDEVQARSLYVNAATLIEELPVNTPEREEQSAKLGQDLQVALNDIRHLITIPNPPLLADLESLTDGVFGNSLLLTDDIYVAGSDGRLYELDRTNKRFRVVAIADTPPSPIAAAQEEGRMYILGSDGAVSTISLEDQSISPSNISDGRWVDAEAYANRLYVLRPGASDGQVVRYNRSGTTFESETGWITSRTVSLEHAVSLAIDGNVYVLMKNGSISRFASGSEEGWEQGLVDPRITNATKLWTDGDSDYLYVLEPSTQRLIVYRKDTGEFVVQYRSDAFEGLSDFIVDEDGYAIYLLAGSKLYSIAPSHIE